MTVVRIGSPSAECRTYGGGHAIHWIHARKALEDQAVTPVQATVEDDDLIRITAGLEVHYRRNHDPDGIAASLFLSDGRALWKPQWRILVVKEATASEYFHIVNPDDYKPCRP